MRLMEKVPKMKKLIIFLSLFMLGGFFIFTTTAKTQEPKIAGTFYGGPIPKGNYDFALRTVLSFGSPWGGIPNNREQLEKRVWDDLILSFEAYRRGISIRREELEAKITETLKGNKVSFKWKEDPEAYAQWTKETLRTSVEVFENQMQHLAQIKELHDQVLNSINTSVTEEEAFQEFLNEHNSLSVELAEFDELKDAQIFYQNVLADPLVWEQEAKKDRKKENRERSFRRPGFVALEFLMVMWKFPKDAVYEMIAMEVGAVYPPQPIYEGYGVFKVLEIRRADETAFPSRRESYFEQLRTKKKHEGFQSWLKGLREDADIQIYVEPPAEVFP